MTSTSPRAKRILLVALTGSPLLLGGCEAPTAPRRLAPADPSLGLLSAVQGAVPADAPLQDPALLRREILSRMDARIRAAATELHQQMRYVLDEVIPIPYLGIDADPAPGGMKVTHVYGGTGAAAAGVQTGDLLVAVDGMATDSRQALAKAIRGRRAGGEITLHLRRDGEDVTLPSTLSTRPEEDEDEEEQFPDLPGRPQLSTEPFRLDFEAMAVGEPASHLDTVLGGHGEPPRWIVRSEDGNQLVRQESRDRAGIHFPMALAKDFEAGDVVARVRLRYSGGEVDEAGGIVLRYVDAGNYVVARVNAAEGDLRIFRSANGIRKTLPGAIAKGATDDHEWHTLEFRAKGPELTATLDGTITVTSYDSMFLRGRAGIWTKSDSVTDFDDLSFEPLPGK